MVKLKKCPRGATTSNGHLFAFYFVAIIFVLSKISHGKLNNIKNVYVTLRTARGLE